MKKLFIPLSILLAMVLCATGASAALLSYGLNVISNDLDVTVSALRGEDAVFSAEDFCNATGAESFESLRITSLPDEGDGVLYFGDVCAVEGQVISSDKLSSLRFSPERDAESASFGLTFDGTYSMTCNVVYKDKVNTAPEVIPSGELVAFTGMSIASEMRACDKDGDRLYFEVVDYPENGNIRYDSKTGEFTYTAGSMVADDSFTYRVKDESGDYSKKASLTVSIIRNEYSTELCDMKESLSLPAALAVADRGYMSPEKKEGKLYFSPQNSVSRLEFLVSAMSVFGADNIPKAESTGFADDGAIPEEYKGHVYSAAKLGIIASPEDGKELSFRPDDAITKAEAAVILNSIIGYKAEKVESLDGVPSWALSDVCAMYELGVYSLEDQSAEASNKLDNESAAEMLYQVSCLLYE